MSSSHAAQPPLVACLYTYFAIVCQRMSVVAPVQITNLEAKRAGNILKCLAWLSF